MPAGDRTGPQGQGPRTGRGKGLCNGNSTPGFSNDERRRGAGQNLTEKGSARRQGRSGGRGRR